MSDDGGGAVSAADEARGPETHPEADLDLLRGELDGCRREIGRLRERDEQWKRLVRVLWVGVVDKSPDHPQRQPSDAAGVFADENCEPVAWMPGVGTVMPLEKASAALAALLAEALEEEG